MSSDRRKNRYVYLQEMSFVINDDSLLQSINRLLIQFVVPVANKNKNRPQRSIEDTTGSQQIEGKIFFFFYVSTCETLI